MTREEGGGVLAQIWRSHPSNLPVSEGFSVEVKPKVGLHNLFRMLEHAYRLESFRFLHDLFRADTLHDLYERLAGLLSRLILERTRRGAHPKPT